MQKSLKTLKMLTTIKSRCMKIQFQTVDDEAVKKTIEGLKSSAGFIRRELAHRVNLRNTPEITFVSDQSIAYAAKMSKLIDEVNAPLHAKEQEED